MKINTVQTSSALTKEQATATALVDSLENRISKYISGKNGEITLDELEKNIGSDIRTETLEAIRSLEKQKFLVFVVGRKSRKSRIFCGTAMESKPHKAKAVKRHFVPKVVNKQTVNNGVNYQLRVTIGESVKTIPIGLELIAA